jgi:hypothetical protein
MAVSNVSEFYRACRDNNLAIVTRLLPSTSIPTLNSLEPNGSSCLHAASSSGNRDIIRLLLENGASRLIKDRDGRTPVDVAQTREVAEMFARLPEEVFQHYAVTATSDEPPPDWLFGQDKAEAFSRAIQWGCVKDRGMKKTMKKIDKANVIHDSEESKEGKLLRYYFNEAREKDDPTFLLKAYTINGSFYNYFNKYMATGSSKEVYDKLCHGWSGCYTGAIMKNPKLDSYRFSGITYRGMVINRENLKQYERGVVLTNKAFQSTSKLPQVSLAFAQVREPTPEKVSVLIQYTIIDRRSALDIRTLSEFPEEEEVLMVPGSLFKVDYVNENVEPCQIFLRQLPWTHE